MTARARVQAGTVGGGGGVGGGGRIKGRFDRARKVMSVALPSSTGHSRVPSVVVGTGGREEEERRERRGRAVDGVIYWQKVVERLEKEQVESLKTVKRR